jgi:putative DNA-invertase from lambdoid prophage Rac
MNEPNLLPSTGVALCFGYTRVSTTRQDLSIEAQSDAVRRASEYHTGAQPEEIFADPDTSGSIPFTQREGGHRLLVAIQVALDAGHTVTIIVPKVDRLGRDTVDVNQTVRLLESLGVRVIFLDINVDTRTAMGRAFMQIAAVFAELELARIRERIQTVLDSKRAQHHVIGSVPYGWNAVDSGQLTRSGKPLRLLEDNFEEQKWILHMKHCRDTGMSYEAIATDLNRCGVHTKRHGERMKLRHGDRGAKEKLTVGLWQAGNVAKVLSNKTVAAWLARQEQS